MSEEELLKSVKSYIKVDFTDDDDDIRLMINAAKSYITEGFSTFNEENPVHQLLLRKAVYTLYENKDTLTDKLSMNIKLQESLGKDEDDA